MNQAGRSSGLTAPNGPAQTALVRTALRFASRTPRDVTLVSVHGTGASHSHFTVQAQSEFVDKILTCRPDNWPFRHEIQQAGFRRFIFFILRTVNVSNTLDCRWSGTPLGDPIEVGALGQALAGPEPSRVALGRTCHSRHLL